MALPPFHPGAFGPTPLAMTEAEFRSAFPEESQLVEFKTGVSGPQIQDSAVAFSNADGGVVLIGVADDGTIKGRRLDGGTADDLHQAMNSARDVGRYDIHALDVGGRPLVVLSVDARREGFSQTSSGVVKVRRGTQDMPLFGTELIRFANERTTTRYETTPVAVEADEADTSLLEELRLAKGWDVADGERLLAEELAAHDGRLTVAGALYLLADPTPVIGRTYVDVRRHPADQGFDYDLREEHRGPLHHVLAAVLDSVARHLGRELVVLGARRYELPRLPTVVLREAIANALAHRTYEATGAAVIVELRPSMVVVRSPGGLPEPVTVANIKEANAARNPAVIKVLRSFGLAEDAGRGIDVMLDAMAEEMLDPPSFADLEGEVRVELPIRSAVLPAERAWLRELERRDELEPADRLLLVHAARGETLTNARARELLSVDALAARGALQRLRDAGLLRQSGERSAASYRLGRSLAPPPGLQLDERELDEVVVDLARELGTIRNADVRHVTGLDRAQALSLLDRLVVNGGLVRSGRGRGTRYEAPS